MGKLAEICWEGLTLKHVSDKTFVMTYSIFLILISLFELFLASLYSVSVYFFFQFGFEPNISFYLCGPILLLLMVITFNILKIVIGKTKRFSLR